ncbi:MAG: exonuclease SbcCD subunit D C-terminal domain-containing protein [Myxococcota bacterium]
MRLIHTSDWHLGHSLHRHSRHAEHEAFLQWLLQALRDQAADALLIAGDIFDTVNPSAQAQQQWYRFLAQARRSCPDLDIIVIGGNRDSAARLAPPPPLLAELAVQALGGVRRVDGAPDPKAMVVSITDAQGHPAGQVAAVPFLRLADVPKVDSEEDPAVAGVRELYRQTLEYIREHKQPQEAIIAMGHCYMSGTAISELSERKVFGGNQHALPVDLFGPDVAYVALGHLHLAQRVGADHVRYCGSPIPLSLPERTYPHQVLVVDFEGAALSAITPIRVPRTVDLLRVPASGSEDLTTVLAKLAALPVALPDDTHREAWPFLEVHVRLPEPQPALAAEIGEVLADRRVRLARLATHYTGTGDTLGTDVAPDLSALRPEEVFLRCWNSTFQSDPEPALIECFHELLDQVRQEAR